MIYLLVLPLAFKGLCLANKVDASRKFEGNRIATVRTKAARNAFFGDIA